MIDKIKTLFYAQYISHTVEYEVIQGDKPVNVQAHLDGIGPFTAIVNYQDEDHFDYVDFEEQQPSLVLRKMSQLTTEELRFLGEFINGFGNVISIELPTITYLLNEIYDPIKPIDDCIFNLEMHDIRIINAALIQMGILVPFVFIDGLNSHTYSEIELIAKGWVKLKTD